MAQWSRYPEFKTMESFSSYSSWKMTPIMGRYEAEDTGIQGLNSFSSLFWPTLLFPQEHDVGFPLFMLWIPLVNKETVLDLFRE